MNLLAITHGMGNVVVMFTDLPTQRVTTALKFSAHEAGLSQEKLASKVGMSQSAIGRRLSGDVPLTLEDLEAIANACGIRVTVTFSDPVMERAA